MGFLAGYIVPHPPLAVAEVGKHNRDMIPQTIASYERVAREIAALKPDVIILSSPHAPLYRDYFHISSGSKAQGDFGLFRAPQVQIEVTYDTLLASHISSFCQETFFPAGLDVSEASNLDHGTMVPLYFVNQYYTDYRLVRMGISGLSLDDHFMLGKFVEKCVRATNQRVVYIASGDLSHCQKEEGPYGYKPEGPLYDKTLFEALEKGNLKTLLDFDATLLSQADECGHRSFCMMAGAFDELSYELEVLSHENTFGVGYGFAIAHVKEES